MSRRLLTDKQIAWAREMLKEGYTQKEVAGALFVCPQTLHNAVYGDKPKSKPLKRPLVYDFSKEAECEK